MAESVKVIVRCRPMNNREKDLSSKCVVFMDNDLCSCNIVNPSDNSAPRKSFTFDGVYHINSTTEQIYNEIAYPLVEGVLEGYNSTVFAYGQTGCGKSFTMQGVPSPAGAPQRGIIPRAFEHIFEAISLAETTKYLVYASYLEIYNEEIRDLLGKDSKKRLALKEHADKGVYVQDLSQHPVQNVSDCEELMECGWKNRATGATMMNADSSRSHSIFSISLEMMSSLVQGHSEDIRRGKLNLVDLAGSERQAKTGATGERLKEATKINLSLSALGNVISALVDGKSKHIPYRDSKLTRLLQDSLGGNTKTLMIGCISPADNNYDETLSTLRYANRAKNICNKPVINQDPKDTMLQQYQDEIRKLKEMLEGSGQQAIVIGDYADEQLLHEEREAVRLEFEHKMREMRQEYEAEQDSKMRLQSDLAELRQHYEMEMSRINNQVNNNHIVMATPGRLGSKTPCEIIVDHALHGENVSISGAQQEVLLRLQKLQETMVGGERANDRELKEKRMKKKKASERRLQALAKVLAKVDDDEGVVLQVYDDINQELSLKTDALRKNKVKVRALDREILDLQSEFENERTDYLETIRRQDRQLKLFQQITDKIVPTLRKECNYSNLESIKSDAVWSDDAERWTLPELSIARTKLPPAGSVGILGLLPGSGDRSDRSSGSSGKSGCGSGGSCGGGGGGVGGGGTTSGRSTPLPETHEEATKKMLQKLERSEREDIAGNYFKPKRATELLNRAKQDATKAFNFSSRNKSTGSTGTGANNALNASLTQNGLHLSLNALNLNSSLNSSWAVTGNNWIGNGLSSSPDIGMRRPIRLEALPTLDRKPIIHKRRNGKAELNTMDII